MSSLADLIAAVSLHIPPTLQQRIIVFGSAGIGLRGVDLDRTFGDVDLFVSEQTFNAWPALGFTRSAKNDIPKILVDGCDLIEVWATFPGVTFADVALRAAPTEYSRGMRVAHLSDLLEWKRAQRDLRADEEKRAKDDRDIRYIVGHVLARP
jgi:hypothetical protein